MKSGNGAVLLGRDLTVQLDRTSFQNLQMLARGYGVSPSQFASKCLAQMIERLVAENVSAVAVEIASRLSGMAR